MVSTADREYKETKKIILKKKNLNPRFQKLKDYISQRISCGCGKYLCGPLQNL